MKQVLLAVLVIVMLASIVWLPVPIPTGTDFQVLYTADLGLLHGVTLYDHEDQVQMMAKLQGKPEGSVFVLPYPYPPWHALITLPLALFRTEMAARIWFLLNLMMVMAVAWFLTDGWPSRRRLLSFLLTFLFLPVLGNVWVGQYGAPVLLGAGMLAYGLRKEKMALIVLRCVLLTELIYLLTRRDSFGRRALGITLLVGLGLFAIGFVASPAWPLDQLHSLTSFKGVLQCNQCSSLPMAASGLLGGRFDQAILISVGILVLVVAWLLLDRRRLAAQPQWLVAAAALGSLFISPYLQNYDYILLVIPMLTVAGQAQGLGVAYLLPFAGLAISTYQLDFTLIASTLIVFILFMRMIHRRVSTPSQAVEPIAG